MAASLFNRLGNHLFEHCYPLYRPAYSIFKALTDRAERQLLGRHLKPGMTVVDAGANIGIYSLHFSALVGPDGQVHSFEPSPDNFARLQASAGRAPNVRCYPMAVGAVSQEMALYLSDSLNVDHRMYPTPDEQRQGVPIKCVALDDFFPAGTQVDLIKADIQGFELAAIQGAVRVLADNPNLKLLLEFWPYGLKTSGSSSEAFIDFLSSRGFAVSKVSKSGTLVPLAEADFALGETIYCNVFASRPESRVPKG